MLEVYHLEVASNPEVVILGVALGLSCAMMTMYISVSTSMLSLTSLATNVELEYNSCGNMSVLIIIIINIRLQESCIIIILYCSVLQRSLV